MRRATFSFAFAVLLAVCASSCSKSAHNYYNGGVSKELKGDLPGAIADFTLAIGLDTKYLDAYHARAYARNRTGDYDGAIADFSRSMELLSGHADDYSGRAFARQKKGDIGSAIADYSKAIELQPDHPAAYFARGCLYYESRDFTRALADFRKEVQLKPIDLYGRIRIWLTRVRLGETNDANEDLRANLKLHSTVRAHPWAYKIEQYLGGEISEPALLDAAKDADPKTETGQLCEAHFYAGSKQLLDGEKDKAIHSFKKAIATGRTDFIEYDDAMVELKSLQQK